MLNYKHTAVSSGSFYLLPVTENTMAFFGEKQQ